MSHFFDVILEKYLFLFLGIIGVSVACIITIMIFILVQEKYVRSKRIILAGGPSSGKTEIANIAADYVSQSELLSEKYSALVIPEAAGILIKAGLNPRDVDNFQTSVYYIQRALEENISADYCDDSKEVITIQDRSTVDGFAYIPKEKIKSFKRANGISFRKQRRIYSNSLLLFLESTSGHLDYNTDSIRYEEKEEAFLRSKETEYIYRDVFGDKVIYVRGESEFKDKVKVALIKISEYILGAVGDPERSEQINCDVEKFISSYRFDS